MTARPWKVLASFENPSRDHCVDVFRRDDGSYGFETYRRDPEDAGRWTRIGYHADGVYPSRPAAEAAAAATVPWLAAG